MSKKQLHEQHRFSFVKAISWRILATLTTIVISYFVTGSTSAAFTIGIFEVFSKILLYYGHERLWLRIGKGWRLFNPVSD